MATQQTAVSALINNTTSGNVTFGAACTSGNWIIVTVVCENPAQTITVTDSANSGNYTQDALATKTDTQGVGHGRAGVYRIKNTSATALTVTVTFGGADYGRFVAYEESGLDATSPLDTSSTQSGELSAPSGSVTTTVAGCTVFAAMCHYGGGAAADSGFTGDLLNATGNVGYKSHEHDDDVGVAGVKTLSFGMGSITAWGLVIAAYKPTSGGGGGGTALMGQICT